jgi:hypothetical protein
MKLNLLLILTDEKLAQSLTSCAVQVPADSQKEALELMLDALRSVGVLGLPPAGL